MRPRGSLSRRQEEVLGLMAQGYNNTAIAGRLELGTKSVENYIHAIYQELNLNQEGPFHPRVQAVLTYIRGQKGEEGWILDGLPGHPRTPAQSLGRAPP